MSINAHPITMKIVLSHYTTRCIRYQYFHRIWDRKTIKVMAARLNLLGSGIYRNHWGINTNHLQLPVNMEGPTHVRRPRPQPHHPHNHYHHLLWWTICWRYCRWYIILCCLVNELHTGSSKPAWTWKPFSRLGMVRDISVIHVCVFTLCRVAHAYLFHQYRRSSRYLW